MAAVGGGEAGVRLEQGEESRGVAGGSGAFLLPGKDYSEAEALIMTFSLNNYAPGDPKLAQAKLWEGAFLEEMRAFQRRTAGVFQVTFMAEVGAAGSLALGQTVQVVLVGSCIPILPSPLLSDPELTGACPGGWGDAIAILAAMSELQGLTYTVPSGGALASVGLVGCVSTAFSGG